MPSALIQLAEDVRTALAGHTFTQEFNIERVLAPVVKLEELTAIQLIVRPATKTGEDFTRKTQKKELTIQVAVIARLNSSENSDTDPMIDFMDEIETFFVGDGDTIAPWVSSAGLQVSSYQVIPYDEDVLFSRNQFTGLLSLTFDDYQ